MNKQEQTTPEMRLRSKLLLPKAGLHERMRAARRRQERQMWILAALFALMLAAGVWYHFVFARTPEYAMRQLLSALAQHDAAGVERYVNLPRVLDTAYNELTDDMLRYDAGLTARSREQYQAFYGQVKPQLLENVAATFRQYAGSGDWTLPEGTSLVKGRLLGVDFERFLERSQMRNTVSAGEALTVQVQGKGEARGQVAVRNLYMPAEFTLSFVMEQCDDGHWQLVRLTNYHLYLEAVAQRQNRDIADYIAETRDIVRAYNGKLESLRWRFRELSRSAGGYLYGDAGERLCSLLEGEVIPCLKERQLRLNGVKVPLGAQYLANQRSLSTNLTVGSWLHFIKGVRERANDEFQTAETLGKQALDTDLRITDIIHHHTVSQALPDVP